MRGRRSERKALDRLLDDVEVGQSAVLVLHGEPGVGKTVLLRYLAAQAAASNFQIARIAGVESEMELAYAGLHQLCSPLLDHLERLPGPQRWALSVAFGQSEGTAPERFLVGLATLSLLAQAAESSPLLCLIDDAQWLDDASAQVLGFVARRLAEESIALIFAVRERGEGSPLLGLPELRIGGISPEDARALVASVVPGRLDEHVVDRIIAETGGNPLALLELPRDMTTAELAGGFGIPVARSVPAHVEDRYRRRVHALPEQTQRLMLVAAADPLGDATIVWRAADQLGVGIDAAMPAEAKQLVEFGTRVRFRHPLVRSAVYHSASDEDRRAVHQALAKATDPAADPDRRAWHRAQAASGADPDVASELEQSASRAQSRGGSAAAAALLERAAELTPESPQRIERRLVAAQAHLRAGAFDAALAQLAIAESEAEEEFARARIELLRGLVASAARFGGQAPRQLLKAAKRLEPIDVVLARRTYLDAWAAALFAGHLASPGGRLDEVSHAARTAPRPTAGALGPFDDLLDGLASLITDGPVCAAPILRRAVQSLLNSDVPIEDWLHWGVLASSAAVTLWDFECWAATSGRQVNLARNYGALAMLSTALNGEAMIATWRGDLESAGDLVAEDAVINEATGSQIAPYGAMLLMAYQGQTAKASHLVGATIEDSVARGEGLGVDLARWTSAILNNGVGRYAEALAVASPASNDAPGLYISTWMLPERIEAAIKTGRTAVAAAALQQFEATANVGDSNWGLAVQMRCRAMLSEGDVADNLYRESIERINRTPIRTEAARAHLLYGEWLRREGRRLDARAELRVAYDMFAAMGAVGFADRTRGELSATGVHVGGRSDGSHADLTAQEEHIARLARDGRTNPEIAAELFISARTVEWHLRKVFTKLGISSRRELGEALRSRTRPA